MIFQLWGIKDLIKLGFKKTSLAEGDCALGCTYGQDDVMDLLSPVSCSQVWLFLLPAPTEPFLFPSQHSFPSPSPHLLQGL